MSVSSLRRRDGTGERPVSTGNDTRNAPCCTACSLLTLRRHIGDSMGLILGGRGAPGLAATPSRIGAVIVQDLSGLPPVLALFV